MSTNNPVKFIAMLALASVLAACTPYTPPEQTGGEYSDDTKITAKVKDSFIAEPQLKTADVDIQTVNGVVQLSGFVDSDASKAQVAELAQHVKGVRAIHNDVLVRQSPPVHEDDDLSF